MISISCVSCTMRWNNMINMITQLYLLMFLLTFAMISEAPKVPSEDRESRYQNIAAGLFLNYLNVICEVRGTEKIKSFYFQLREVVHFSVLQYSAKKKTRNLTFSDHFSAVFSCICSAEDSFAVQRKLYF